MIDIFFDNKAKVNMTKFQDLAIKVIEKGVSELKLENQNIELSITFLNEAEALKMNKTYRNKNYIPDVISFPIFLTNKEMKKIKSREIGDIFICFEEANKKAIKYMHTIEEEMCFLFAHGFLHLLGYDHEESKKREKEMFDLQEKILLSIGVEYQIKFAEEDYEKDKKHYG
ncbi:16S rRNA maturation RNase YbeY [Williamsoniiplasma somnilux]|uniref:Endoribonuclease YbeY n=1 Tax=Williamsoniiplasma somnilux TaxID=215578 RepID=A0A2K8NY87_9MOLU|nr:rRNA maturation RNase YbeY [Williamsoniiplasma somnilux]ATZ18792.1 16S rRNA maturation RNase YbeY [Williamsoniiplasma somnilux]